MIQRIVRKALWGLFFFAFFEKFFVPILTSGGYVGLSIATLLSQHHQVTAVDIIPEKVDMINNRKSPIQDDYICPERSWMTYIINAISVSEH